MTDVRMSRCPIGTVDPLIADVYEMAMEDLHRAEREATADGGDPLPIIDKCAFALGWMYGWFDAQASNPNSALDTFRLIMQDTP